MSFGETVFWFYVALATTGFTFLSGYMAFCGLRQYIDEARTGGAYRAEDENFRAATRELGRDIRAGK